MNDVVDPQPEPKNNKQDALFAALKTLAEVQTKDSEVRSQELEVRTQEIASNERIAMKSIEVQERFHADNRLQFNKHLIHRYAFVIVALLVVFAFAVVMVLSGAKDLIIEAFKVLLAFAAGAFGGFHAGKGKKDSDE